MVAFLATAVGMFVGLSKTFVLACEEAEVVTSVGPVKEANFPLLVIVEDTFFSGAPREIGDACNFCLFSFIISSRDFTSKFNGVFLVRWSIGEGSLLVSALAVSATKAGDNVTGVDFSVTEAYAAAGFAEGPRAAPLALKVLVMDALSVKFVCLKGQSVFLQPPWLCQ